MGAGKTQGMKGGRKLRRCGTKRASYEKQFHRTAANKMRRAVKRRTRKEMWAARRLLEKELAQTVN